MGGPPGLFLVPLFGLDHEFGDRSGGEAAVAVVIKDADDDEASILLMERARRDEDPWSGQVGLPGGRREPEDLRLLDTAIRETAEEVGVRLDPGSCAGRLPPIQARHRGALLDLWVHPFVFVLDHDPPIVLGPEASASLWLPKSALFDKKRRTEIRVATRDGERPFPAILHPPYTVWGLTHRMLSSLGGHLYP